MEGNSEIGAFEGAHRRYVLRFATPEDAPIVAHHRAAMFRDMGDADEAAATVIENASMDHVGALIEAREYVGFLVECGGEVIAGGGVWLRPLLPRPGHLHGSTEAYILNVYTEPAHRRAGVARFLMNAILDWSGRCGVARVSLHASPAGEPLYRDLGFEASNEFRLSAGRLPR